MEPKGDIALIGLAVMGQNLVLNMNDRGFTVAVFNRTTSRVDEFLANEAKGTTNELAFNNYSGGYFLAEVRWSGQNDARGLLKSKAELELAKATKPKGVKIAGLVH